MTTQETQEEDIQASDIAWQLQHHEECTTYMDEYYELHVWGKNKKWSAVFSLNLTEPDSDELFCYGHTEREKLGLMHLIKRAGLFSVKDDMMGFLPVLIYQKEWKSLKWFIENMDNFADAVNWAAELGPRPGFNQFGYIQDVLDLNDVLSELSTASLMDIIRLKEEEGLRSADSILCKNPQEAN